MSQLSLEWNNEAYVSLHLVQKMLEIAGLPPKSSYSHWHPQFPVYVPSTKTKKPVDFLIEDMSRFVSFFIEVKSASSKIDDSARYQLKMYVENSGVVKFGLLIDPFLVEIYQYNQGSWHLWDSYNIINPHDVKPVANFLYKFLESVKMRTIAIHSSKGGVGKTTLTVNIAFELAKMGNKVLVIDLDDQASSSLYLGVNKANELDATNSVDDFDKILKSFEDRKEVIDFLSQNFSEKTNYKNYIQQSSFNDFLDMFQGKIDVIPGSYRTRDEKLPNLIGKEKQLNKALQKSKLAGDYDYVVIDTPPSSTMIANNGLCAAQYVIIPTQMEYFSVYGIRAVVRRITNELQEEMGKERGNILGIVPIMTQDTKLNKLIKDLLKKYLKDVNIFTEIPRSTYWSEACQNRLPMAIFAEGKSAARESAMKIHNLTQEIINQINQKENEKGGLI